jgi:uncharacterized damage-inducible protein DinB
MKYTFDKINMNKLKELLLQYSKYNYWANQRLLNVIISLPAEVADVTIVSSFESLRLTLSHMLITEQTWWQRVKPGELVLTKNPTASLPEISEGLIKQSMVWNEWLERSPLIEIEQVLKYQNSRKEEFEQPVYQLLLHLFNHQSYHRGQLVTMLNQLNIKPIPATDFIIWSREK